MPDLQRYYPGTPAKWETVRLGLIPCRVLEVFKKLDQHWNTLRIELTADRGPYRKGEVIETSPLWVFPLDRIRRGQYYHYLLGGFCWAPKEENEPAR